MKVKIYSKKEMNKIVDLLLNKNIVAFPTDTVFGLACITNEEAIKKIYLAKGRSFDKALPMMCSDAKMINEYAYLNEKLERIINKFSPGPITYILRKKDNIDEYITNGKDTIAIRIPDDDWILELINKIKIPLMVTSANISEKGSLLKWKDVYDSLKDNIDSLVCSDARGDISSTIVDLTNDVKIIREGPIKYNEIMEAFDEISF